MKGPLARGGGLVVGVLVYYFDNPSSSPAGDLTFMYAETKVSKKMPG